MENARNKTTIEEEYRNNLELLQVEIDTPKFRIQASNQKDEEDDKAKTCEKCERMRKSLMILRRNVKRNLRMNQSYQTGELLPSPHSPYSLSVPGASSRENELMETKDLKAL